MSSAIEQELARVIRHYTDWPTFRSGEDTDLEAFLVKRLSPAMWKAANEHEQVIRPTGAAPYMGSTVLAAWGEHLGVITEYGCVYVPRSGAVAIGSGYAEALGHLGDKSWWTRSEVIEAARRATLTAVGCGGDIYWTSTSSESVEAA